MLHVTCNMEMEGQFIWEASNMSRNLPGLRILKQMQNFVKPALGKTAPNEFIITWPFFLPFGFVIDKCNTFTLNERKDVI